MVALFVGIVGHVRAEPASFFAKIHRSGRRRLSLIAKALGPQRLHLAVPSSAPVFGGPPVAMILLLASFHCTRPSYTMSPFFAS